MSPKEHHPNASRTLSRRRFLKYIGAGLFSAALAALEPPRAWAKDNAAIPSAAIWKRATYAQRRGQTFTVNGSPAQNLSLKLVQVQDGTAKIYRGPNKLVKVPAADCFVLIFRGPREPALPQDTYEFAHAKLGKFSLFITPGEISPQGQTYQAIFNLVHA